MYIYFLISLLSSTQPLRVAAAHPPLSIMELGSEGSEHHGCLTWVASSKCLIRKPSGLRFFFCFFQRTHCVLSGSPDDLCASSWSCTDEWLYNHLYEAPRT